MCAGRVLRKPSVIGVLSVGADAQYVSTLMPRPSLLFRVFAVCALLACLYHVIGAFGVLARMNIDRTVPMRHAVFVGITLALAWYFVARPVWGLPVFAALVVQQTNSHGRFALSLWQSAGRIDVISVLTLAVLYAATVALVRDARARLTSARSA